MTIAQRIGRLNNEIETRAAAREFIDFARIILLARGVPMDALALVEHAGIHGRPRLVGILKAAVAAGTTTDLAWAEGLSAYRTVSEGFVSSLATFSAFDKILADNAFRRVPLKTKISVVVAAAVGSVTGEAKTKLISRLSLDTKTLEPRKSSCIVILSDEIVRAATPAAIQLLGDELRRGVARATDTDFIDTLVSNADIETVNATGSTLDAFLADLDLLAALLETGADARLYLIAPPRIVKALALMRGSGGVPAFPNLTVRGGDLSGITVLVSDALTTQIVFLDASAVASDSSVVLLEDSGQSSLQFDDAPTDGATTTINLWQSNSMALRAERWAGYTLLRPNGCVVIDGADYGGTGTGT